MKDSLPLWRKILSENFVALEKLSSFLELNENQKSQLFHNRSFPLNLPRRLAEKIEKGNLNDPILKQFVPFVEETEKHPSFVKDPVGDCSAIVSTKCLQKYAGRVLLLTSGICAMHCRYCFRQNFNYPAHQLDFSEEIRIIQKDSSIKEIILSGGDPLSLENRRLKELLLHLSAIEHVKRIRFHTRFPIGIPERIDDEFLSLLESCPKQIWFIIHCNHPAELDRDIVYALKRIQRLGIPVLNQWVLLKGVNDSVEVLHSLCETLIDQGIFPYYLHQLDRVEGAAHFEVSQDKGRWLISELNKRLAGYGVPKYVQENFSQLSKTLIE